MTKIFQCCLRFDNLVFLGVSAGVLAGLSACAPTSENSANVIHTIHTFQRDIASTARASDASPLPQAMPSPRELLAQASPWRGFEALDPYLSLVRLEKITKGCRGALAHVGDLQPKPAVTSLDAASLLKGWGESDEDYTVVVEKCDSFPCGVKLNAEEVGILEKKPKKEREPAFREVVLQRVARALKTGERKEFEFSGDPIDPFAFFVKKGLPVLGALSGPKGTPSTQVWSRKLDLAPGKMRVLRQVVQSRFEKGVLGGMSEARLELRDLYTTHYFDSWGEWVQVQCDGPVSGAVTSAETGVLIQALVIEFDLLKKNDLISMISKGKMRNGVRERGSQYLDQQAEQILK